MIAITLETASQLQRRIRARSNAVNPQSFGALHPATCGKVPPPPGVSLAMAFQKSFEVRWAEIDVNWHLKNTSFAELGTSTRISFLSECGFPPDEFARQRFGPVVLREETRYSREIRLGQTVTYTLLMSGMSADGSHFEMYHDVMLEDGSRAATIHVEGSWIDLDRRKLRRPPRELHDAMLRIERTSDFRELRSLARNPQ